MLEVRIFYLFLYKRLRKACNAVFAGFVERVRTNCVHLQTTTYVYRQQLRPRSAFLLHHDDGLGSVGHDVWYSVVAGLFPQAALAIVRATDTAPSDRLEPLWALFRRYGSLRVMAAAAELMGKAAAPALPFPLRALHGEARETLAAVLERLQLA